ncbi:MAG: radical SAM protein, partial [Acidobacteriota bacterium]
RRDFVWFCEGHPSRIVRWPETVKRMVDSGLVRMQIGIESGSRRVIEAYRKQTTLEEIERVVEICRDAGLPQLCGNIIIGGADESRETLEETREYVDRLLSLAPGMLDVSLTIFMPFPGTAMTRSPESFGMRVRDGEALTTVGDYPVVETENMALHEIATARKDFWRGIFSSMRSLEKEGKVPHKRILSHYRLHHDYGISSIWHSAIYSKNPFLHRRYTLIARSGAQRSADIPAEAIAEWRPTRVFSLWNTLSWEEGFPRIFGFVLSPLEYEIILHCSGKYRLKEMVEAILRRFPAVFPDRAEAEGTVLNTLGEFERRHWLVFVPF